MNKIFFFFISTIIMVHYSLAYSETNYEKFINGLSSTNNDEQFISFHKLAKYSTNTEVMNIMVNYVLKIFHDNESGLYFKCSYMGGEDYNRELLETMISLKDVKALPVIIAGSGDFGGGGLEFIITRYSNEMVPYLIDAMKNKTYYGRATDLTHWLINSTNCILTDKEKSDLKTALLMGHYENHYGFDEPWLSSIVLRLSPTDEEISKYKLFESIESLMTNADNLSLGWVPGNITKIKDKKIRNNLVSIVKRGHEIRSGRKILFDEKKFKTGLPKTLSLTKQNEMVSNRKEYLEGERQRVITEISNTMVELNKE